MSSTVTRVVALDLIRFVAALMVVVYHYVSRPETNAFPSLSQVTDFGYLGVPLFFMISGYVIALSADQRTLLPFFISRFVRLYPALWAGVLLTALGTTLLSGKTFTVWQILANFTLLQDYLGQADVDGVYWTLKQELKFYACIGLLIALGWYRHYHIWLPCWLILAWSHYLSGQPSMLGMFISPAYSSFFIFGIALYLLSQKGWAMIYRYVLAGAAVLNLLLAYQQVGEFIPAATRDQGLIAALVVTLLMALLASMVTGHWRLAKRPIYLHLGALTYPLYLVHNALGKALLDQAHGVISEGWLVMLVTLCMICLAWLIYYLLERPLATPLKRSLLSLTQGRLSLSPAKG